MRKLTLLIAVLLVPLALHSQDKRLVVRRFAPSEVGDMRARTAPVYDNNRRLAALIEITFAGADSTAHFEGIIGTPQLLPGEWLVRVPEGASRLKISVPACKPLDYAYPASLIPESARVYKLDLAIEETVKLRTLIMPFFSYNRSQTAYGLMLGFCKNNGGYIRFKSDFHFGIQTSAECDAEGMMDGTKAWFTGKAQTSRFALTTGYMRRLFDLSPTASFYGYVGGGYGDRTLAWQMFGATGEYEYARVTSSSFRGVEAEAGILLRLRGIALSVGAQTNQFKYYELNAGIGVMF